MFIEEYILGDFALLRTKKEYIFNYGTKIKEDSLLNYHSGAYTYLGKGMVYTNISNTNIIPYSDTPTFAKVSIFSSKINLFECDLIKVWRNDSEIIKNPFRFIDKYIILNDI